MEGLCRDAVVREAAAELRLWAGLSLELRRGWAAVGSCVCGGLAPAYMTSHAEPGPLRLPWWPSLALFARVRQTCPPNPNSVRIHNQASKR